MSRRITFAMIGAVMFLSLCVSTGLTMNNVDNNMDLWALMPYSAGVVALLLLAETQS